MNTPDQKHIMLDLETMGTGRFSPVVAIGACRFSMDVGGEIDLFYQVITLESCMGFGLKPTAGTINWWLTHPSVTPEARAIFKDPTAVALPHALDAFTDWMDSRPDLIWGNSAAFDCGMLTDAYTACSKEQPWAFYRERCYRTVKGLPCAQDVPFTRQGTAHNALDDAVSQAAHLREIYKAAGWK